MVKILCDKKNLLEIFGNAAKTFAKLQVHGIFPRNYKNIFNFCQKWLCMSVAAYNYALVLVPKTTTSALGK